MKETIRQLSHGDLDGISCVILSQIVYGEGLDYSICKYYSELDEMIENEVNSGTLDRKLVITDLSISKTSKSPSVLMELVSKPSFKGLEIVDHHLNTLETSEMFINESATNMVVDTKYCATKLYYMRLVKDTTFDYDITYSLSTPFIRDFVECVNDWDTWKWIEKGNIPAKKLSLACSMLSNEQFIQSVIEYNSEHPLSNVYEFLNNLTCPFNDLLYSQENDILLDFKNKAKQIKHIEYEGYKLGVVICEKFVSEIGDLLAIENPNDDIIVLVSSGTVSFRSKGNKPNNNCKEFASVFGGGGGHFNSAGCTINSRIEKEIVAKAMMS